ncbi:hypothetical protein IQ273_11835 [Nodosilinea sp. LEGE 07298]|uniref:hypothetical protein n=1 Tax=Nodosilinea sp. LEGE 07298 TaxID=2777970 RepID=UPI00187E8B79|nr:hypothetical protein [Nodosilinea sp. LEGE 07298]MBE9110100.1 hypothetical protein [Nodosilinea sp. LEGE 07298]
MAKKRGYQAAFGKDLSPNIAATSPADDRNLLKNFRELAEMKALGVVNRSDHLVYSKPMSPKQSAETSFKEHTGIVRQDLGRIKQL